MSTNFRHTMHVQSYSGINGPFVIPVENATSYVYLERKLEDVQNGVEGESGSCMDAYCALREKGKFSHPVYMVEFNRGRLYVVDQLDANDDPIHCIRYSHNDSEGVKMFDKMGRKGIIESGQVEKTIICMPPPRKVGTPGVIVRRKNPTKVGVKGSKGSLARKIDSLSKKK